MAWCAIGLDNPKSNINVGSALRAAKCYGASFVAASGKRYSSACTDTEAAYLDLPLLRPKSVFDLLPYDCIPIAVELTEDAEDLRTFVHPDRAYYIFGAEDNTLGRRVLDKCKHVVKIPTASCMNLAATVNVVLYDRLCKLGEL